eukprot:11928845-Karenia_brevis.AAC.1
MVHRRPLRKPSLKTHWMDFENGRTAIPDVATSSPPTPVLLINVWCVHDMRHVPNCVRKLVDMNWRNRYPRITIIVPIVAICFIQKR